MSDPAPLDIHSVLYYKVRDSKNEFYQRCGVDYEITMTNKFYWWCFNNDWPQIPAK